MSLLASAVFAQAYIADQFQLLKPGLTISVLQQGKSSFLAGNIVGGVMATDRTSGYGVDALGNLYQVNVIQSPQPVAVPCVPLAGNANQIYFEIERRDALGSEVIARVPWCVELADPTHDGQLTNILNIGADSVNGRLFIGVDAALHNTCSLTDSTCAYGTEQSGIVVISGLPPLVDIITTYQPMGAVSMIAPKHPEGLLSADRLQLYAGRLRDLPNFGNAIPVACSLPFSGPPKPGDLISLADPLTTPAIGEGNYFVVGVEQAGVRRFGRQYVHGVMSGRDPAAFAACN